MFFFPLTATATIILSCAFFMLAMAKNPEPMSQYRQKLVRYLLFGVLWNTIAVLASHMIYTLQSFTEGSYNLFRFPVYSTPFIVYLYSWRNNLNFWDSPLIKSYRTLPYSFTQLLQTLYILALSLAVISSIVLLFTSFNRRAKVAALTFVLVAFLGLPFSLTYMFSSEVSLDISDNPTLLWFYFLQQLIIYLTIIVLVGVELRSMKTFAQLRLNPLNPPNKNQPTNQHMSPITREIPTARESPPRKNYQTFKAYRRL